MEKPRWGAIKRLWYRHPTGICEIDGCKREHLARGLCASHYRYERRRMRTAYDEEWRGITEKVKTISPPNKEVRLAGVSNSLMLGLAQRLHEAVGDDFVVDETAANRKDAILLFDNGENRAPSCRMHRRWWNHLLKGEWISMG